MGEATSVTSNLKIGWAKLESSHSTLNFQLNGVAKRVNKTVVESARNQMYGKLVPLDLWGLAILCAANVQNRVISSNRKVTPFQL